MNATMKKCEGCKFHEVLMCDSDMVASHCKHHNIWVIDETKCKDKVLIKEEKYKLLIKLSNLSFILAAFFLGLTFINPWMSIASMLCVGSGCECKLLSRLFEKE